MVFSIDSCIGNEAKYTNDASSRLDFNRFSSISIDFHLFLNISVDFNWSWTARRTDAAFYNDARTHLKTNGVSTENRKEFNDENNFRVNNSRFADLFVFCRKQMIAKTA
jgi:hypothetical protein